MSEVSKGKKARGNGRVGDLIAKILCVLLAFLLWFYVMIVESPADEQVIRDVPVTVAEDDPHMLAKGLSVFVEHAETVDITISGKRRVLSRITAEDITVRADLSGIASADRDLTVPLSISVPEGCQLVSSTKYSTQVNTDTIKKTLIPLVTELENPNPDYIYGKEPVFSVIRNGESAEVTVVSVEGPASMVSEIAYAVVRMNVSGKERSFTDTYTVELEDERGVTVESKFLKQEFASVNVTMSVETEKVVPLTYTFKQNYFADTEGTTVFMSPEEVTVLCAPADAHRTDLVSPIELDERKILTEDSIFTHILTTTVRLVSPYTEKIEPSEVTVTIHIDDTIKKRYMSVAEILSTGGIDIDCRILDEVSENVVICGTAEALIQLTSADIVAVVDLSEYGLEHIGNRYRKKVTIEIDSDVAEEVFVVGDYTVEFEITEKK